MRIRLIRPAVYRLHHSRSTTMEAPETIQLLFDALQDQGWLWSDDGRALVDPVNPELWVGVDPATGEFDFSDEMVDVIAERIRTL
jgi:hypothetical protein